MAPKSPSQPGDPPPGASRQLDDPSDTDSPDRNNGKRTKHSNTTKDNDTGMFQQPDDGHASSSQSASQEVAGPATVNVKGPKPTSYYIKIISEQAKEIQGLKEDKKIMNTVIETLKVQTAKLERLEHVEERMEAMMMERLNTMVNERVQAVTGSKSNATKDSVGHASVPNSNTAPRSAPNITKDTAFPPLGPLPRPPLPKMSFASVASEAPVYRPLEKAEYDLFHPRPISRVPVPQLPNDGSDLVGQIKHIYVDNVDRKPISMYKKLFRDRGIPSSQILSMDFVQSRRSGEDKVILEIMCYASNAELLKRTIINRWGAQILPNYSPSQPWNPNASADIQKLVGDRYRACMLRHANRTEDLFLARRRLFGQLFVKAGGKEEELETVLTDDEKNAADAARAAGDDFEEPEQQPERMEEVSSQKPLPPPRPKPNEYAAHRKPKRRCRGGAWRWRESASGQRSMLDSGEERLDYVFIGETFHQQETALKGLSFFVGSSRRGRGGHRGGVALLARSALKERITSVRVGEDWVGFEFAGLRIGGAYLSPSLGPFEIGRRLKDLDGGRKLDLVYGDFNVDLGQIVGRSGFPRPVERVEEVLEWGTRWELEALTPLAGEAAKRDQVFRRRDLFANLWVTPKSQLPFKTDHPLLRVNHYAENGHTDAEEEKGAERYRISLLQHEEVLKRYRREFNRYGPELEALAKEVWEKAASASREEKKTLVDTLDLGILERINKAAKDSLGTYHASAIRNEPDTSAAHLVKSPHPSDALRLFKRSQRGRQPRVASEDPNKSPMAEAVEHYKSVFGSEAEVPELDEEEEEGEWEGGKRETDALLSTKKVVSVINRYGRHKSPGSDSIHVILLSALCPSNPQKSKKPPKKPTSRPDWTRTDPSLSPPPHFLIPTQPSMLNPLAPVFHPGSPASDTPQDFPLPRLLSSLFRLSVACGETPERWGSTRVALISKLKGPEVSPIPSETRPIALLPMFRRLFEILLLPLFDPLTHAWASLNNRQAGFRSGWSCASSILVVDAALATEYPCGGFLDFKSAYDSPSPRLILRSFKKLGMPSYLRRLVWSLLTAGASISVIVNGSESEPFERRRGFPQGSPLSPLLFNLYLDSLLTRLNSIDGSKRGPTRTISLQERRAGQEWKRLYELQRNGPENGGCGSIPRSVS
ncbi:hypothetical protein JCM16303_006680 [Sporobolomyces ruberrimus]